MYDTSILPIFKDIFRAYHVDLRLDTSYFFSDVQVYGVSGERSPQKMFWWFERQFPWFLSKNTWKSNKFINISIRKQYKLYKKIQLLEFWPPPCFSSKSGQGGGSKFRNRPDTNIAFLRRYTTFMFQLSRRVCFSLFLWFRFDFRWPRKSQRKKYKNLTHREIIANYSL